MTWQELQDPHNRENKNAGNGGDLVKHTVYLTILDYLLARRPWSDELRVRECHAGRGMYALRADDSRRTLLGCLYNPVDADIGMPLHDVQRASQDALGLWPARLPGVDWYSGSAMINAWRLAHTPSGTHRLELYELAPDTRKVLRAVFADPALELPRVDLRILPEPEDWRDFDGEEHIAKSISGWSEQDLVLLDPFAMWRQDEDRPQRDRYRRIVERLIARGQESPSMILFWTWGRAFPVADGDLDGTGIPVANGYQALRDRLHRADRHFIRVRWRWGLQFAMWVLAPTAHLQGLRSALERRCDELRDHLLRNGCHLEKTGIEVIID